jgi:hypothetical protein
VVCTDGGLVVLAAPAADASVGLDWKEVVAGDRVVEAGLVFAVDDVAPADGVVAGEVLSVAPPPAGDDVAPPPAGDDVAPPAGDDVAAAGDDVLPLSVWAAVEDDAAESVGLLVAAVGEVATPGVVEALLAPGVV